MIDGMAVVHVVVLYLAVAKRERERNVCNQVDRRLLLDGKQQLRNSNRKQLVSP